MIEMLVVVAIIGILVSMLFPALQSVRQAARRTQCSANLRQVILATLNYETGHRAFPPGDDGRGGSFVIPILSFMKQEFLHQEAERELEPGETFRERAIELSELQVEPLNCPASFPGDEEGNIEGLGDFTTHYHGIMGPVGTAEASDQSRSYTYEQLSGSSSSTGSGPIGLQGVFSPQSSGKFVGKTIKDIRDGTTYTFGFGEVSGFDNTEDLEAIPRAGWALGAENQNGKPVTLYGLKSVDHKINFFGPDTLLNTTPFSSNHPGGAQFTLLDGAVLFVDENITEDVLKTFCSIDAVERPESLDEF